MLLSTHIYDGYSLSSKNLILIIFEIIYETISNFADRIIQKIFPSFP